MASKAYYPIQITDRILNGRAPYRVHLSYGIFSIRATKEKKTGNYYAYAYKRSNGKLYKSYVGKIGQLSIDDIYNSCLKLRNKIPRGGRLIDKRGS